MDVWTNNDRGFVAKDGTIFRYNREDDATNPAGGIGTLSFFDGTFFTYVVGQPNAVPSIAGMLKATFSDNAIFSYNTATSVSTFTYADGAVVKYDAGQHAFSIVLPAGSTYSVSLNGATIAIDVSGNVNVTAAGNINLVTGAGSPLGVSVEDVIFAFNTHTHQYLPGNGALTPTATPIPLMT